MTREQFLADCSRAFDLFPDRRDALMRMAEACVLSSLSLWPEPNLLVATATHGDDRVISGAHIVNFSVGGNYFLLHEVRRDGASDVLRVAFSRLG